MSLVSATDAQFAAAVARLSLGAFRRLPKSGKPQPREWTVLAAIVQSTSEGCMTGAGQHAEPESKVAANSSCNAPSSRKDYCHRQYLEPTEPCSLQEQPLPHLSHHQLEVVALGTGSKCLGTSNWCPKGSLLHDSHAEVIAKRSLQLYLIDQAKAAYGEDKLSIFMMKQSCRKCSEDVKTSCVSSSDIIAPEVNCELNKNTSCASSIKNDVDFSAPPVSLPVNPATACNGELNCGSRQESGDRGYGRLMLKPGIAFHMYISHTPCGDCSILPKQDPLLDEGKPIPDDSFRVIEANFFSYNQNGNESERKITSVMPINVSTSDEPATKKLKTCKVSEPSIIVTSPVNDIHRTGAKCAAGEAADSLLSGSAYHRLGPLRTKPGRGDRCMSHCCSDKMLRWSILGVQGGLLMTYLEHPVYLESVTIGDCAYSQEAMERGLFRRFKEKLDTLPLHGFKVAALRVLNCDVPFEHARHQVQNACTGIVIPCPASLSWYPGYSGNKSHVIVDGRKIGVTKKALGTVKSQVPICRQQIMMRIRELHHLAYGVTHDVGHSIARNEDFNLRSLVDVARSSAVADDAINNLSYKELKLRSVEYYNAWQILKTSVLCNWTCKPEYLQDFKIP